MQNTTASITTTEGAAATAVRTAEAHTPAVATVRGRIAERVALLAGPVLTVAGLAVTPWESERTTLAYHESLLGSPTQAQVAALLLAFGYAGLGLAALTALRRLGRRSRKLFGAAALFSFLGATLMPGQLVTDFYDLAMAQTLPADAAARASDATHDLGGGVFLMVPAMLGFLLGPVLVAALAAKEKVVGLWAPVAILAGFVLTMAVFSAAAMVAVGLALVAVYAAIAHGLARRDAAATQTAAASHATAAPTPAPLIA